MKKLRWGVLSTAKIGVNKVIPAMQQSKYCEITAAFILPMEIPRKPLQLLFACGNIM